MYTCMHVCMCACACMHVCMYACVHVCMCACVCAALAAAAIDDLLIACRLPPLRHLPRRWLLGLQRRSQPRWQLQQLYSLSDILRPPSCRSPSKSLLFILCRESTGQGFICLAVRALRCADGGVAAVPCSHAFGSLDLDSRLARTFFITLCTSRSPLWMILVLVRAVHHDAVPPAVASARYPQTGPAAGLLACRPPHADQPAGQSQQRRAP